MITINGIDYMPVRKHGHIIPNYYVSKNGEVWNNLTKKHIKPYVVWRGTKGVGKPKCMDFSMTALGQPWWDRGYQYKPKKGMPDCIEFRMKVHLAVMDSWDPYIERIKKMSREQLEDLVYKSMMIDHKNDDPLDNRIENLEYSNPFANSNYIKEWN